MHRSKQTALVRLTGHKDDVLVEVGGLLYRIDCVERTNGRVTLHVVDDLKETREMLKAIAGKAKRRPPQAIYETTKGDGT